jgi:hypothetical protein
MPNQLLLHCLQLLASQAGTQQLQLGRSSANTHWQQLQLLLLRP